MPRLSRIFAFLPIFAAFAGPASAAEFREYDQASFSQAQAQGRPVLIDVHAWWCPVCAQQNHVIKQTTSALGYAKLLVLRVDYDKQKPIWKAFDARKQATLIGFDHGHEVGRVAYMTNKDVINALLAQTVR